MTRCAAQAERESWREAEKKRNMEELRRIKEYQEMQQKRYDEMMAKKKASFDVQDSIMQQLARDMEAKRREVCVCAVCKLVLFRSLAVLDLRAHRLFCC